MTLALSFRFALRDWRAGELRLLLVALLVAVGTVSAISLFVDRLQKALLAESATFLAADRVISGSREIPEEWQASADELGLQTTRTLTFPSMVFAGEDATLDAPNQLVSVKAVGDAYPLRGVLRIADEPFGVDRVTDQVPARGEAWLDSRLLPALGLSLGDRITVGYEKFTVSRVLSSEPDRGGSFFDFGPRLLMHIDDVPATRVIQPGSRIGYRLLMAGDDDAFGTLYESLEGQLRPNFRWQSIKESSPSIGRALDRAESFLMLGGLLAVLLAGIAVALGANRYARRHYDHVGVLKTLGATPKEIQIGYFGVLGFIGIAGVLLGLVLGVVVHLGLIEILSSFIPVALPLPGFQPIVVGFITGFICLLAFAMPPLIALKKISPMRVVRRDIPTAGVSSMVTYSFAAAGILALLIWYSGSFFLTFWALVGGVSVSVIFAGLALLLLRGGRALGMQARSSWRLALAGLQRRYRENTAQIMIFGMAIMLLLILLLIRTALIDEWQDQIPQNTPNHFIMNIAPDETDAVSDLLDNHSTFDGALFPMIRGRVTTVNDMPAREWSEQNAMYQGGGPRLQSERNLTFTGELPENNNVVSGEWWVDNADELLVSLEDEYAAQFGLEVGDVMSFDVGGIPLTTRVANLRSVEWESVQPNFFIIFSPGALEGIPATYMTSFFLEPENKRFLNELLANHPTITVIEVDEIIQQVQSIVARVTQAVELVLILVLGSGVLVLVASIQSGRDGRMKEHALLRALGGSRSLISGSLASEFAILGVFAGIVAVIGAEITVFALETQVFELGYSARPWLWGAGPLFGMVLIATVGYLGTRKLVQSPPATVLREL